MEILGFKNSFISFLNFYKRKYIHTSMRGYKHALRNGKLEDLRRFESSLCSLRLPIKPNITDFIIFGPKYKSIELVARQYLLQYISGDKMRRAIMHTYASQSGKLIFPMPPIWQEYFSETLGPVKRIESTILWYIFILFCFLRSIVFILKLVFYGLCLNKDTVNDYSSSAYFFGLRPNNLPVAINSCDGHDVCSWYARSSFRRSYINTVYHDVFTSSSNNFDDLSVKFKRKPYLNLTGIKHSFYFILWAVSSVLIALISLLMGNWSNALLLGEAAKAFIISLSKTDHSLTQHFFHYSRAIYRPLWSYFAESKGAEILCYFYSTYSDLSLHGNLSTQLNEWGPSSWSRFLVFDKYNSLIFARDLLLQIPTQIVGIITFSDSSEVLPPLPNPSVLILDISPHRSARTFGISQVYEYIGSNPNFHQRFLSDITIVLSNCGIDAYLKRKRNIDNKLTNSSYISTIKHLCATRGLNILSPDLCLARTTTNFKASISQPFTSAALAFFNSGIPSIYYDPFCVLDKSDPGAHGVPVISGVDELANWAKLLLS